LVFLSFVTLQFPLRVLMERAVSQYQIQVLGWDVILASPFAELQNPLG